MVLELGDEDEVARAELVQAPRVRDEVDRLGRVPDEDHLARAGAFSERAHLLACALELLGRPLGEPVDAAVDVRVRGLVELVIASSTWRGFCVEAAESRNATCLPSWSCSR